MFRLALLILAGLLSATVVAVAQPAGWETYIDETFGFSAGLPLDMFAITQDESSPGLTLKEVGGEAVITIYGGPASGMTPQTLEANLSAQSDSTEITYRDGGDTWFVLSGFDDSGALSPGIFYTKVMFSEDRQTFSAFEITFPAVDKPRLEAVVERFEDNFTRPQ